MSQEPLVPHHLPVGHSYPSHCCPHFSYHNGFLERGPLLPSWIQSQSHPFKINPCSCSTHTIPTSGLLISLSPSSNPCLPLSTPQFISMSPIPSLIPVSCLHLLHFSSPCLSGSLNAAHSCLQKHPVFRCRLVFFCTSPYLCSNGDCWIRPQILKLWFPSPLLWQALLIPWI